MIKYVIIPLIFIAKLQASGVVCSEMELMEELEEDLADNGQLDCLRDGTVAGSNAAELDAEALKKAEAANWTSDCSFEAKKKDGNANWLHDIKKYYGLTTLYDVKGEPYGDFNSNPDQADMCEIVRSLIFDGKLKPNKPSALTNEKDKNKINLLYL